MWIDGEWYTESDVKAHIHELKTALRERTESADNGARQIAHYENENRDLKRIIDLAKAEIPRPYPEYKYRFEAEAEKVLAAERTVFHKETDGELNA